MTRRRYSTLFYVKWFLYLFWPRYCDCVCKSRFVYSGACSDHNVALPAWRNFNLYTWLWFRCAPQWLKKFRHDRLIAKHFNYLNQYSQLVEEIRRSPPP